MLTVAAATDVARTPRRVSCVADMTFPFARIDPAHRKSAPGSNANPLDESVVDTLGLVSCLARFLIQQPSVLIRFAVCPDVAEA